MRYRRGISELASLAYTLDTPGGIGFNGAAECLHVGSFHAWHDRDSPGSCPRVHAYSSFREMGNPLSRGAFRSRAMAVPMEQFNQLSSGITARRCVGISPPPQ